MKMKNLINTAILVITSIFALNTTNYVKTSAYSSAPIDYDHSANTSDVGMIAMPDKHGSLGVGYEIKYIVVAFDSADKENPIETINRMGFRIRYTKATNFFHSIGNWFEQKIFNNPPKYGEIVTVAETVNASKMYSLKWKHIASTNFPINAIYGFAEPEKLDIPAIGRMSQLLAAEKAAKEMLVSPGGEVSEWIKNNLVISGYNYKGDNAGFNVPGKTLPNREFYAIIPFNWAEDVGPESIDCVLFDGTHISDGLNEDGKPFVNEHNEKYIEAVATKDFGLAINGNNAVLKRIEVRGYDLSNDTIIKLNNANYDYETHLPINTKNTTLITYNQTTILNWEITNNNRYIFISSESSAEEASKIKIRFIYENSSDAAAWLLNVTDGDGNFLPGPIPLPKEPKLELEFKDLLIIMGVVAGLVVALALAYDFLKTAVFSKR